jgi:hypothetical protein
MGALPSVSSTMLQDAPEPHEVADMRSQFVVQVP